MNEPFVPRVGGVMSADIAVPEFERTLRFYSRVLGTGEQPLWREDLMNNQGAPIIGLGPRSEEYAHLPLQWMPHIQVADVAVSAKRAVELGGRELMHAKGDDGQSQWAVLLDPHGAAFGVIPVVTAEELPAVEAGAEGGVGCIAWFDLTVADARAARDFYCGVVGWTAQDVELEDGAAGYADYTMVSPDGTPTATIRHARGDNQGLPPVWLLHLPVGDLDGSLSRVGEEGGRVVQTVRGADGEGVRAVVQDPVGAALALVARQGPGGGSTTRRS